MVQKSCASSDNVKPSGYWGIYHINWLAGFLRSTDVDVGTWRHFPNPKQILNENKKQLTFPLLLTSEISKTIWCEYIMYILPWFTPLKTNGWNPKMKAWFRWLSFFEGGSFFRFQPLVLARGISRSRQVSHPLKVATTMTWRRYSQEFIPADEL